ncbi:putative F-box domain-containing protein [Helianthus annuus]|nr:putative F-box domain-containing protein [Helianthus annuus]
MSDNIPFEIQSEIIKRLPVKSLIQFRTVSKPWKSLIDSSPFINKYSSQHTQSQRLLVTYDDPVDSATTYVSIADDDTFPQQKEIAVVCNLSIRKAVGVVMPDLPSGITFGIVVGFGVCRETMDPKIVKITYISSWDDMESISSIPSQVEVFTLSSGAWRGLGSSNLPRKSIRFNLDSVVIDGVLYWLAADGVNTRSGYNYYMLIISFDLTSEEFGEIHLPDSLARVDDYNLSISKVRNSLVVLRRFLDDSGFSVWMMPDGVPQSFIRMFTIKSPDLLIKGFRKNGEPIIEMVQHHPGQRDGSFFVAYDPCSKDIINLEIDVFARSFCVFPYIETLLLLDQPDFVIYDQGKATLQSVEPSDEGKNH